MKLKDVTSIQVADDTFVAAAPELVVGVIDNPSQWRRWWPDLRLVVTESRGAQGIRWSVDGPVKGTMEIWCERVMDGFTLHYFMHGEPDVPLPDDGRERWDALAELNRRRRVAGKVMSFEVKDRLESGREIGGPAVAAEVSSVVGADTER